MEEELEYKNFGDISIGFYKKGPVGIGVSGGADSAILLYILMCNIHEHIHIYNMMGELRRPALEKHFDAVVKTCSLLSNNKNYTVHKNYVTPDESAEFYINMLTSALDKKEVDIIYLGLTKFPPKEEYLTWPVTQQPEWHNEFRSEQEKRKLFGFEIELENTDDFATVPLTIDGRSVKKLTLDERAYIPLFNHNKKDVASLYRLLQVEKELLPVTRSCENDHHTMSHCKQCWWCYERKWGFGYFESINE
jgi:hypothetical protein